VFHFTAAEMKSKNCGPKIINTKSTIVPMVNINTFNDTPVNFEVCDTSTLPLQHTIILPL
jgi:hypothetical protein